MYLFLKYPENYISLLNGTIVQVKELHKIGCEDCPNCQYYTSKYFAFKVRKCKKCKNK
jgi:ribosomal protein L37AE/L43A